MKYLLDTQILIWLIENPSKLTKEVVKTIETTSALFVSIESLREIAIKYKRGDIKLKKVFSIFCKEFQQAFGIKIVTTDCNHVLEFYSLTEKP
jgi:PIN domain nuclease of toxin-antitoxin system